MPAKLKIPEQHHAGVAAIVALDDIQAQSFFTELDGDYGHSSGKSFARLHSIAGLEPALAARVYDTLRELYKVREREHMSIDEFADELVKSMNASGNEKILVADADSLRVRNRLTKLLSARGFGLEAKANGLRRDAEHVYCASRVLTDVRPVFGDKLSDGPVRTLIMQTLRLGYHDYEQHRDLYVSLSEADVARLIEHLTRAQEKARLLRERYGDKHESRE